MLSREQSLAHHRRWYREKCKKDPQWMVQKLEKDRERHKRLSKDPQWMAQRKERHKRWYKEKRKEDPQWIIRRREGANRHYREEKKKDPKGFTLSRRVASLWANHRLRLKDYDSIYRHQQQRCAICREKPKNVNLEVDHDHAFSLSIHWTKRVRGLLCRGCNLALERLEHSGHPKRFHNNPVFLRRALEYLKHPPVSSLKGRLA